MTVHALHEDCVVCLANEEGCTVERHTRVLLLMLQSGVEVEGIIRDLCFVHRRLVEDDGRVALEEVPDAG